MTKTDERVSALEQMYKDAVASLETYKEQAATDLKIDEFALAEESLRSASLHTTWSGYFSDEAITAKKLLSQSEKIELERWKYYNGKQPDKYYADYGQVNIKILKGDLKMWMTADPILSLIKEIVNVQYKKVDFIERTVKQISSRSFDIKNAIEWRRFESGM